ncbi:hypothetical protein CYMTET_5615, partial [Cymbomonas tetramitiformis]
AERGGALVAEESDAIIQGATASGNTATEGGGLYARGSRVTVTDANLSANVAEYGGGGIYAKSSLLFIGANTTVEANSAQTGGGISLFKTAATITETVIANNRASYGGGMVLQDSDATFSNVTIQYCSAQWDGGGIYSWARSTADFSGGSVAGCVANRQGGAIKAEGVTTLVLNRTALAENRAGTDGGAVSVTGNGTIELVECQLAGNAAIGVGGALELAFHAVVALLRSSCVNNSARSGGAAIVATTSTLDVERSVFGGNAADIGGALYFQQPPPEPRPPLRQLHFDSNVAMLGPAIMWEYNATAAPVECHACTGAGAVLFASTARSYTVWQGEAPVGAEGISCASGAPFSPELSYRALDYYGNVTWRLDETAVLVEAEEDGTLLDGQTVALYNSAKRQGGGGAQFKELTPFGPPNTRLSLVFQPQTGDTTGTWGSVVVPVALNPCQVGEQYLADAKVCRKCSRGSLKLTNDSRPCTWCADFAATDMVECQGGAQYSLLDGAWGSLEAGLADCLEHDTVEECVLARVWRCDVSQGCVASGAARQNVNGSLHVAVETMCGDGYRNTAVLCGDCEASRYRDFSGECQGCFSSAWATAMQVLMYLAIMFGLVGLAMLMVNWIKRTATKLHRRGRMATNDKPWYSLLGSLMGNVQVVAQTMMIYNESAVPDVYRQTTQLLTFSFTRWLPLECVANVLGMDGSVVGGFYGEFILYAGMPFVVSAIFYLPILVLSRFDRAPLEQPASLSPGRKRSGSRKWSLASAQKASDMLRSAMFPQMETDGFTRTVRERSGGSRELGLAPRSLIKQAAAPVSFTHLMGPACGEIEMSSLKKGTLGSIDESKDSDAGGGAGEHKEGPAEGGALDGEVDGAEVAGLMLQLFHRIYLRILIFLHPVCATYMFALFNCRQIYLDSKQYWLELDTRVECFTSQWWLFSSMATVVVLVYVLLLPCCMAAVPWYLNQLKQVRQADTGNIVYVHERRLRAGPPPASAVEIVKNPLFLPHLPRGFGSSKDPRYHIISISTGLPVEVYPRYRLLDERVMETALADADWMIIWGPYLTPYKREMYAWVAFDMMRKVATTSMVTMVNFVRADYGLLYNSLATSAALAAHAYCQPFNESLLNRFQLAILGSQNVIVLLCIGESYEGTPVGSLVVGITILTIQAVLCGTVFLYYVRDMMHTHSDIIDSQMRNFHAVSGIARQKVVRLYSRVRSRRFASAA